MDKHIAVAVRSIERAADTATASGTLLTLLAQWPATPSSVSSSSADFATALAQDADVAGQPLRSAVISQGRLLLQAMQYVQTTRRSSASLFARIQTSTSVTGAISRAAGWAKSLVFSGDSAGGLGGTFEDGLTRALLVAAEQHALSTNECDTNEQQLMTQRLMRGLSAALAISGILKSLTILSTSAVSDALLAEVHATFERVMAALIAMPVPTIHLHALKLQTLAVIASQLVVTLDPRITSAEFCTLFSEALIEFIICDPLGLSPDFLAMSWSALDEKAEHKMGEMLHTKIDNKGPMRGDIGRVARCIGRLLAACENPQHIAHCAQRLSSFSANLLVFWERSILSHTSLPFGHQQHSEQTAKARKTPQLRTQCWQYLKTSVFVLLTVFVAVSMRSEADVAVNAHILASLGNVQFIIRQLGMQTMPAYQEIVKQSMVNTLAVSNANGSGSRLALGLLRMLRNELPWLLSLPSYSSIHPARRDCLTYFMDIVEQLIPVLDEAGLRSDVLPLINRFIDGRVVDPEIAQTAHALVLVIFSSKTPSANAVAIHLAPYYSDALFDQLHSNLITHEQFRLALTTVTSALFRSENDSVATSLAVSIIERLLAEIDAVAPIAASDSDSAQEARHTLIRSPLLRTLGDQLVAVDILRFDWICHQLRCRLMVEPNCAGAG
ncbi:hypothetical protein GQ42DRAFT_179229 [Ramicandelaber brevisporus]|nr:hypothetical protein GQ42DRAFT_179229 [Ramicandelaber brevisporus]